MPFTPILLHAVYFSAVCSTIKSMMASLRLSTLLLCSTLENSIFLQELVWRPQLTSQASVVLFVWKHKRPFYHNTAQRALSSAPSVPPLCLFVCLCVHASFFLPFFSISVLSCQFQSSPSLPLSLSLLPYFPNGRQDTAINNTCLQSVREIATKWTLPLPCLTLKLVFKYTLDLWLIIYWQNCT